MARELTDQPRPPSPDTWDPDLYARFWEERRQPFVDLLALVDPVPGGRTADLGCGNGRLTLELHGHVGAATTIGVDSSAAMLAEADTEAVDGLQFVEGDLATWEPDAPLDVVLANASLQWVPNHPALFARLHAMLVPGGQLAVQVPANFSHPSHIVADEVGQQFGLPPVARFESVLTAEGYAALLDDLAFTDLTVRLQVYVHHLPSTRSVIEWVKGTLLTEHRRQLGSERFEQFLATYTEALLDTLGDPAGDRPYTHLFNRILLHGRRA
ncbi:MAG: methyltransferase domain-containing protein [Acidimicrobiia bacterium]|nr:methyltransferase domain-containing protein [Acidimicrobiia bacterium]